MAKLNPVVAGCAACHCYRCVHVLLLLMCMLHPSHPAGACLTPMLYLCFAGAMSGIDASLATAVSVIQIGAGGSMTGTRTMTGTGSMSGGVVPRIMSGTGSTGGGLAPATGGDPWVRLSCGMQRLLICLGRVIREVVNPEWLYVGKLSLDVCCIVGADMNIGCSGSSFSITKSTIAVMEHTIARMMLQLPALVTLNEVHAKMCMDCWPMTWLVSHCA